MTDYFKPQMTEEEMGSTSVLGFAHIGDAVYEILIRTWLCKNGKSTSKGLHVTTVRYVCAAAQARAAEKIMPKLADEELTVYKRGRNAKVNSVPKNAQISDYHAATGLETLFGWLYFKGETDRISQLFAIIVGEE